MCRPECNRAKRTTLPVECQSGTERLYPVSPSQGGTRCVATELCAFINYSDGLRRPLVGDSDAQGQQD